MPERFSELIADLDDLLPARRLEVVRALGKLGAREAIPHLVRVLQQPAPAERSEERRNDVVRQAAVEALADVAGGDAVPILIETLEKDGATRGRVFWTIWHTLRLLGTPEALAAARLWFDRVDDERLFTSPEMSDPMPWSADSSARAETWFKKGMDALKMAFTSDHQSEFQSDMAEALTAFSSAVALQPDFAEAWFQKGLASARLERHHEAAEAHQQVVRYRPEDAKAWLQLAHACKALEKHEAALAAYLEAARLRPGDDEAHFERAAMLLALGRPADALAAWTEWLQSPGPDSAKRTEVQFLRAQALAGVGSRAEAAVAFREAIRRQWSRLFGMYEPSSFITSLKHFQEARDALVEEAKSRPEGPDWKSLGGVFQSAHRSREALTAYDAALAVHPEDPDLWYGRAEALVQADRRAEAVPAYEQALRLAPDHHCKSRLRVVLKALGRFAQLRSLPGEDRTPVVHRPMDPWPTMTALDREEPAARRAPRRARITIKEWSCAFVSCYASAGSVRLDGDVATIRGYAARQPGADCVQVSVAPADKPRLLKALRAETGQELFEIDERYAPSYCSQCRKVYCPEHWAAEESYPPGSYHKCPSDHIRSLYMD